VCGMELVESYEAVNYLQLGSFDLVRAISELGYKVRTQKVILPVQGMSCDSCVNRIRSTLKQVPGVIAANINFVTEKAAVEYILGQVAIKDLAKAIEAAGYKILEIDENQFVDK